MIGTEIGNYRILEKLGEGGMGVVYKAVDVHLDRIVAIKALNAQLTGNPELEQRFRNEAKAQANLNHTNLATLYALLIEGGRPFMVMEFIEGDTFEQMVQRRGPIPSEEAIPLFRQALLGLGYAHRMGIVHRDIKPSNMMLNRQGIVKVMDFGIAKVLGARGMTKTGTQMGTAFYMSPEQVLNRNVDIRSDIYSLGVTLYEMLAANVPFSGDSDYQIMTDHVSSPPPLPTKFYPYIPQGVQNAVMKALEKNPDARFQTVEEFGAALERPEAFVAVPLVVPGARGATVVDSSPVNAIVPAQVISVAPAKTPFFTPERKIMAGGTGIALLLIGGWLALRPTPKNTGAGFVQTTGSTTGSPITPSGGELRIDGRSAPAASATDKSGQKSSGQLPSSTTQTQSTTQNSGQNPAEPTLIPAGTVITIRMIDSVDSSRDKAGQRFEASVDVPVVLAGRTVIPRGASAKVLLASANQAGHIEGRSDVKLELVSLSLRGAAYAVRSSLFDKLGASRGKRSAVVIGGGAAVGAAIGGIFGRKKGAAIGAGSGAAAGTGTQLMTKSQPVIIPSETIISFTLRTPIALS